MVGWTGATGSSPRAASRTAWAKPATLPNCGRPASARRQGQKRELQNPLSVVAYLQR